MKLRYWLFVSLAILTGSAVAQDYPTKPVRVVVPYPPGGATDLIARQLASKLTPMLGQSVVVENRAGASGGIGFDHVAKSAPDGYTLLMGTANMTIVPAFTRTPYDPVKDFAPISTVVSSQNLLTIRPSLPVNNLGELIAYAKANPGKLNYGSSGIGTPLMTIELLKALAGIDMKNIPYKGDAPAINDLLGGQIDMYASTVNGLVEHVRTGRLRALGVTSTKRAASIPNIPTIAEAGVPGYELTSWYGILAPAGTPEPIVRKLNSAMVQALAGNDLREQLLAGGSDPSSSTPEQFVALVKSDVEKYARLVKQFNLKAD
jgi:tripartite-type tricarboxylate transporter receptor subunit TctC